MIKFIWIFFFTYKSFLSPWMTLFNKKIHCKSKIIFFPPMRQLRSNFLNKYSCKQMKFVRGSTIQVFFLLYFLDVLVQNNVWIKFVLTFPYHKLFSFQSLCQRYICISMHINTVFKFHFTKHLFFSLIFVTVYMYFVSTFHLLM